MSQLQLNVPFLLTHPSDSIVFLTADFIALVVQAVGGAMASMADTLEGAEQGAQVMLGGIGLQFAALVIYTFLAAEFLIRLARDAPVRETNINTRREVDAKVRTMILGLVISAVLLFIRCVARKCKTRPRQSLTKHLTAQSTEPLSSPMDGMAPLSQTRLCSVSSAPASECVTASDFWPVQTSSMVSRLSQRCSRSTSCTPVVSCTTKTASSPLSTARWLSNQ